MIKVAAVLNLESILDYKLAITPFVSFKSGASLIVLSIEAAQFQGFASCLPRL